MTWGTRLGARGISMAASVAVAAAAVLGAPVAASAASPSPATAPASPAAATQAPADPAEDAQPRMDEYAAADFEQAAAALPPALVEAAARDLGKTGAEYLASAEAASDAADVVQALTDRGVDVLDARLEGTELTVSVGTTADAAVVAESGARAEIGAPELPDFSAVEFVPALDVYDGQGYVWENQDGTANQCSVGFTGFEVSSGKKQFATAGHCLDGMSRIVGPVRTLDQTRPGDGGSFGDPIGSPVAGSGRFGGGYDTGLIAASAAGVVALPSVLTWGGGSGAPIASAPLPVTGQSVGVRGADLCKSGSRTGWSCGTVLSVDETVSVSGANVNTIVTDACVQPGDSGGAALSGQRAVGVVSGSTTLPCSDPSHFSVLFPMLSARGASVQAKYGSAWEPAVTVSTPVVTSVVGGSPKAAGSLSGTLANAAASSSVQVYIDGSSTAFATADASSGRWTVSLDSLGPGSHRFSVVAGWGSWSRSAAATGIVTVTGAAAAAAGDVVRAPDGALYLVDGTSRLVPVPSTAVAAEFRARPALDVTAAAIAAYRIDTAARLGIAVSCGPTSYLAGGGQLWRLPSGSAGGLPVTGLDPATCAAFAQSSGPANDPVLLRSPATGDIYLVQSGTKNRLASMGAVFAFGGAQPAYVPVSGDTLAGIPNGRELLAPASLVKTAGSPAVYFVDGSSRRIPLASFDTAVEYGVSGYTTVSDATLGAYAAAPAPLSIVAQCSGSSVIAGGGELSRLASGSAGLSATALDPTTCGALPAPKRTITGAPFLRDPATGAVHLLRDGKKSPLTTMSAVIALGGGAVPPFVSLSGGSLGAIPTGRELLGPGTLVKTAASPVVYLVDGLDRRVPIDSFALAAEFGATGYSTVPDAVLRSYVAASGSLSLAVTCRSSHYVAGGGSLWTLSARSSFGLRTTALRDSTCAALRTSPQAVAGALFVRNPETGAVYNVTDGRKTYLATMGDIYSRNGGALPVFVPVSPSVLTTLP
ncbi:S1 family peptidase [Microbacteriaceae bacterium 4G12]